MTEMSTNNSTNWERRKFLKKVGLFGVATTGVPVISNRALAKQSEVPDDQVLRTTAFRHTNHTEVVNGGKPQREAIYHTISVDLYRRIEAPFNAANDLLNRLGEGSHFGVGVRFREKNARNPRLKVHFHPGKRPENGIDFETVKARTPEKVTGSVRHKATQLYVRDIPVSVEKSPIREEGYFDDQYRPIPGGCEIRVGSDSRGTLATPAWDNDYNVPGWTTAGHLSDFGTGQAVYQPYSCSRCSTGKIGTVTKADHDSDSLFLEAAPDHYREFDLAKDGGGYMGWTIYGILSEATTKEMVANWEYLRMQGRTTGRHYEQLYEMIVYPDSDGYDRIVYWNHFTDGGDSGGPFYHLNSSDDAYIAGSNAGAVKVDDKYRTHGPAAYEIEKVHNITV